MLQREIPRSRVNEPASFPVPLGRQWYIPLEIVYKQDSYGLSADWLLRCADEHELETVAAYRVYCVGGTMIIRTRLLVAFLFCFSLRLLAQQPAGSNSTQIRDAMKSLSSDAMQGRGSGTPDELAAANYLAGELRAIGITPAGDKGGYIQDVSGVFQFYRESKQWNTVNEWRIS